MTLLNPESPPRLIPDPTEIRTRLRLVRAEARALSQMLKAAEEYAREQSDEIRTMVEPREATRG